MLDRNIIATLLMAATLSAQQWQTADSSYKFSFPRDHFEHLSFQTEWWYYTGNLRSRDGHHFGFELTFFRQANSSTSSAATAPVWQPDQLYLAHLALSDIDAGQFFHTQRLNRSGPGLAGGSFHDSRYWNGNWEVRWIDPAHEDQQLQAVCQDLLLKLRFSPDKPFVIHGVDGISRKGPLPGETSHYISLTRLNTVGELDWKGRGYVVDGTSWMDHEFFSEPPDGSLLGWDWFAIQLSNHEELMLYRLRRKSGEQDPYSSGTFVDREGKAHHLSASQFVLTPGGQWKSAHSGRSYPLAWHISVPSLALDLQEHTALQDQELFSPDALSPSYWEGAVTYTGAMQGKAVSGFGYLEMTGYAGAVHLGGK